MTDDTAKQFKQPSEAWSVRDRSPSVSHMDFSHKSVSDADITAKNVLSTSFYIF